MTITHNLLGRTGEVRAACEVHTLHAHGEHDLVDSTLRVGGKEKENEKMRMEGRAAAGRLKPYLKYRK